MSITAQTRALYNKARDTSCEMKSQAECCGHCTVTLDARLARRSQGEDMQGTREELANG